VASERNLKKSIAILLRQQRSILFHGGLIRFRFALMAATPMNIDAARKDIQDWNERVQCQTHLGSEEGQSNRNDVDEWRHQRPVHRSADQASIEVTLSGLRRADQRPGCRDGPKTALKSSLSSSLPEYAISFFEFLPETFSGHSRVLSSRTPADTLG